MVADNPFLLGDNLVWLDRHRLRRNGTDAHLQPKLVHLLKILLLAPGQVVKREDLLSEVWGTQATDDQLSNAMWKLRRVLGDTGSGANALIETIPKCGYRLTCSPDPVGNRPPPRRIVALICCAVVLGVAGVTASRGPNTSRAPDEPSMRLVSPLLGLAGIQSGPSFGGQGTVAYVSPDNSYHTDLFVFDQRTGESRQLTRDNHWNFHPALNRKGQVAVYTYGGGRCWIDVHDVQTTERLNRLVCPHVDGRSLKWSADGDHLLLARYVEEGTQLVALDWTTGEQRALENPGGNNVLSPAESVDGSALAALEKTAEGERVVASDRAPGPTYLRVGALEWAAPERIVYSASDVSGRTLLYLWPRGEAPYAIAEVPGANTQISVDVESGVIGFDATRSQADLWALDERTRDVRRVATTVMDEYGPAVSPDGRSLAWLVSTGNVGRVWIRDLQTGESRALGFLDHDIHAVAWITARRVVASAVVNGNHDLLSIDLDTTDVRRLIATQAQETAPAATPDGRYLFFVSRSDQEAVGYRLEVASGRLESIMLPGLWVMRPSPDGAIVYYRRYDKRGLWRAQFDDGEEQLVDPDLDGKDWGNWVVDDTGVLVVARVAGGNELRRYSHDTPGIQDRFRLSGNLEFGASLSLASDGTVYFAMRNQYEGDLLALSEGP